MMVHDHNNELGLAVSYYNLYSRLGLACKKTASIVPATESEPIIDCHVNGQSTQTSIHRDSDPHLTSTTVVQDVAWSKEHEVEAASLLEASLDKCRISQPLLAAESEADSWNRFYRAHQTNFFKDKHYLETDFPKEFTTTTAEDNGEDRPRRCCVEIGCGVGNAVLPLLLAPDDADNDSSYSNTRSRSSVSVIDWTLHCLDLSQVAVDLLVQDSRFVQAAAQQRAFAYCCDLTQRLPQACRQVADVTTLFFCLSAMDPSQHVAAARNVCETLKPGGTVVLRDYGRYDAGQMKLGQQRDKLVADNFYRKQDGTKCFYFTLDDLHELFVNQCGLQVLELRYLCKLFDNRSTKSQRRRVWVSARFQLGATSPMIV
jgi:SAM-dependent methyltransferase